MKGRAKVEALQLALKAAKGRLGRAEFALAELVRAIRERAELAKECSRQLSAAPLDCEDSGFATFADRRRNAIMAQISAHFAELETLYAAENSKRADVQRFLRQKISLEAAEREASLEAAKGDARRL